MGEKEKKIIDRINKSYDDNTQYVEASAYDWKCIVDLIEKQQIEIEELNMALMKSTLKIVYNNDYISKDKIREKVIEVKNRLVKDEFITASQGKLNTIIDLEELLEERN